MTERGNQSRSTILKAIHHQPGITRTQLVKTTQLAASTITHHLQVLKRQGHIEWVRIGRCIHIHSHTPHLPHKFPKWATVPLARKLAQTLKHLESPTGPSNLARITQSSPKRIQKQLDLLLKCGIVTRDSDYHPRYALTSYGQQQTTRLQQLKSPHS